MRRTGTDGSSSSVSSGHASFTSGPRSSTEDTTRIVVEQQGQGRERKQWRNRQRKENQEGKDGYQEQQEEGKEDQEDQEDQKGQGDGEKGENSADDEEQEQQRRRQQQMQSRMREAVSGAEVLSRIIFECFSCPRL